jgi:hypothetical protein
VQRGYLPRPARHSSPANRLANASAASGLAKQNTTKSLSSGRREYVSGAADNSGAALNHLTVLEAAHLFGREHNMVRPVCGAIRRPTWVIGINPDKTQGWRTGEAWNGGCPFLIDAMTGRIFMTGTLRVEVMTRGPLP